VLSATAEWLGFFVEVFLPLIDFANGFPRRRSQARSSLCLSRTARSRCLFSRTAFVHRRAVRGRVSESPPRRRCLPYLGSVIRFHTPLVLESGSSQTLPVFRLIFLSLSPVRRVWGRAMDVSRRRCRVSVLGVSRRRVPLCHRVHMILPLPLEFCDRGRASGRPVSL
jgi:hypothetical protein